MTPTNHHPVFVPKAWRKLIPTEYEKQKFLGILERLKPTIILGSRTREIDQVIAIIDMMTTLERLKELTKQRGDS